MLRVADVANLSRDDLSGGGCGEVQELVELMRTNVAYDAAVTIGVPKPVRSLRRMDPMRPEANGLNDLPDRPGLNQLACTHRRAILESFAVYDRVDASCRRLYTFHFRQVGERRNAGFVDHEILPVLHDANAEGGAQVRDDR